MGLPESKKKMSHLSGIIEDLKTKQFVEVWYQSLIPCYFNNEDELNKWLADNSLRISYSDNRCTIFKS
jgi:hypothetical protein